MTRNLKVLLGAAMALAALGAFGVSAAQAHTPAEFHCEVEPCEATLEGDGASGSTTAHHVFVVKNGNGETASFTCDLLTGDASKPTKSFTEVEFGNLNYDGCKLGTEPTGTTTVKTNGCRYNFAAAGTATITGCEAGKKIEIVPNKPAGCVTTVGEQGPLTGITYHNEGTPNQTPRSTLVTASAKVPGIAVTMDGTCSIPNVAPITSEYTTGNTLARGYKGGGSDHANTANRLDVWWTATVASPHTPAEFHCEVEPCEATLEGDGASGSTTAHHVFVVKNGNGETASFTCDLLTGDASKPTKSFTEVEFGNLNYDGCKLGTEPTGTTTVKTNGCRYNFAAAGTATITGCEAGKKIEIVPNKPAGCVITVGEQGPLTGITYHNEGTPNQTPRSTLVTASAKVPGIAVTMDGTCSIPNVAPITSEYTTGNTLARGYKGGGSDHANTANRLDVWWTATVASPHTPAEFHCEVEPCEATLEGDGASGSTTAHHVFVVKNGNGETASFTCDLLTGDASKPTKSFTEVEFGNLNYDGCKLGTEPTGTTTVKTNGCRYNFAAAGTATITGCEAGKKIEIVPNKPAGCVITVGEQGPLTGITYHNEGTPNQTPRSTLVTASAKVPGIAVTMDGTCSIPNVAPITSEYTTGNTLARGYKGGGSDHANTANRLDVWWTATVASPHTPAEFHCEVEPCEATLEGDGASGSTTAHHVFVVKNGNGETASFTCDLLTGDASKPTKSFTEVEFGNLNYDGCKLGTEPTGTTTVKTNGCRYNFAAAGTATITGCEAGKKIEIVPNKPAGCVITVGEQGPLTGITYHNEGTPNQTPRSTLVTASAKVPGIAVTMDGTCSIPNVAPITSEYTTGNTLARGYKGGGSDHANTANRLDVWWTATVASPHTPAEFHCEVEPCEATLEGDGASGSTTAHHVFVVKNGNGETASFTCDLLTGSATVSVKTFTSVEFENLSYDGCRLGTELTGALIVNMNGCKYNFTAAGTVSITGCEAGKKIEIIPSKPAGCIITVGEQANLTGITYHAEGAANQTPRNTVVTASAKVPGIVPIIEGSCSIPNVAPITAEYTTGNTIVRGYKDGSDHSNTANRVDIWWTATVA